jgi:LacI family transcriptional regulator
VVSDDALGMRLAVDHLMALGHRRIAHLAGPAALSTGQARRLGFEQAMAAHGASPAAMAECMAYSIEAGDAAMTELLAELLAVSPGSRRLSQARPAFSAVVAANDLIALGALQALRRAGVDVPDAVSIVGHNDMPLLDQVNPPLTTVRIQHYEMGFRAARLLLEALRGVPGSASTVVLRPELVLRASTAAVPAAGGGAEPRLGASASAGAGANPARGRRLNPR